MKISNCVVHLSLIDKKLDKQKISTVEAYKVVENIHKTMF